MSNSSSSRSPSAVVEIGNDWVKMARVSVGSRGVSLIDAEFMRIGGEEAALIEAISRTARAWKVRGAVACLPRQAVNIRFMEMPSESAEEIAGMVGLQVGRQTPYSRDEIVYAHRVVGAGRAGYSRVMVVIARKDVVRHRFHLMEEAGIGVASLSVSTEGLLHWYRGTLASDEPADGSTLVIDVDAGYTDIAVFSGGEIVASRSVLIGGDQLQDAAGGWADKLLQEALRAVEARQAEPGGGGAVRRVVLTGAGHGRTDAMCEAARALLGADVRAVDSSVTALVRRGANDAGLGPDAARFSLTALVGMAAARDAAFRFVPETVGARRELVRRAHVLSSLGIFACAVIASGALAVSATFCAAYARLAALQTTAAEVDARAQDVLSKGGRITEISKRLDARRSAVNVLHYLNALTPRTVQFTAVAYEADDRVVLRGIAASRTDVREFQGVLAALPIFTTVENPRTRSAETGTEFEFVCVMGGEKQP